MRQFGFQLLKLEETVEKWWAMNLEIPQTLLNARNCSGKEKFATFVFLHCNRMAAYSCVGAHRNTRERRTVQLKVQLNEVYYQQTTCLKAQATPAVASCAQHAGALSWNRGREGSSHRGPSAFLWPGSSASRGQQAASVRSPQRLHVAAASFLTLAAPRARDQRAHAQSLQRRSGSNP